jgi:membrane associated rhomboid family serine protease
MFVPIHDGAPLRHIKRPHVAWTLIAVNVAIWAAGALGWLGDMQRVDTALGVIPAVVIGEARLAPHLALVPTWLTFVTSMFLHGGLFHLAANMLFLWVFGDNVEDAMGPRRFALFYLLCGLGGSAAYVLTAPHAEAPMIGASGAIAGVVVAYLMFYPQMRVFGLAFNVVPFRIPAWVALGLWIGVQLFSALFLPRGEVSFWAHVGGILTGAALTPFLRRPGHPLGWSRKPPGEPV